MVKTDRIQIEYDLTFTTLFHCGTGIRAGLVDRTVVRDGAGYLYVPGSTFKGVLRERCEQLARFYEPHAEGPEQSRQPQKQQNGLIASPHEAEAALQGLGPGQPTMVTRIFGSQSSPGRLFFDDARLEEKEQSQYARPESANNPDEQRVNRRDYKGLQVDLYTQVRLDRPTRTAVSGALYTSEFGTRDITFKGSILGWLECTAIEAAGFQHERHPDEAPTYSLLLLLAGMCMVERLGGNKSTGKGHCTCEITSVEINGHPMAKDVWHGWFAHLDELTRYYEAQEVSA